MKTLVLCLLLVPTLAAGEEGMWTYNNFPKDKVKQKYGFNPDDAWLDHLRLSSVRLAGGCSGSFVSSSGLVMTNHHCAHSCIEQLSTAEKDYVKSGFYAKTQADEVKCPAIEINNLVQITDVTDRINKATAGLTDQKYNEAEKAESSKIEKECAGSDAASFRCDVVSLYHGGVYNLYKYKRFQDVRLVFAPEFGIAFFGGDPDNFNFPRYDLDVSFLRVYENGQPAKIDNYLKWSPAGVKEGDLTFVSGNPGGTSRQLTVAQLEYQRDTALTERLFYLSELRGLLTEYQKVSPEAKRTSNAELFYVENSYKALRGRLEALQDKTFFNSKVTAENALRAKVNETPELKKNFGGAWDSIAKAQSDLKKIRKPLRYIEQGAGLQSDLYQIARNLVRGGDERGKPVGVRFREFNDTALPQMEQKLFSPAPIYDDMELLTLTWSLTKLREELGADDPFIKKLFGKQSPEEIATAAIKGTKLKDVAFRKQLWEGGKKAVDASTDPMILLAKKIDPEARAVRKNFEDNIESVFKRGGEQIAKAHFAVEGKSAYPDATFTMRLSYGGVKGYEENGHKVKPITTIGGAFDRATGRPPFDLPASWISAKPKLDMNTPMNFATDNDIIGGNSGSPVANKSGELVGLVFDGNIQSLGGDYGFDPAVNRMVAVHSEALIKALDKVYGASRIVQELRPKK
jgi:hypothetical protein